MHAHGWAPLRCGGVCYAAVASDEAHSEQGRESNIQVTQSWAGRCLSLGKDLQLRWPSQNRGSPRSTLPLPSGPLVTALVSQGEAWLDVPRLLVGPLSHVSHPPIISKGREIPLSVRDPPVPDNDLGTSSSIHGGVGPQVNTRTGDLGGSLFRGSWLPRSPVLPYPAQPSTTAEGSGQHPGPWRGARSRGVSTHPSSLIWTVWG